MVAVTMGGDFIKPTLSILLTLPATPIDTQETLPSHELCEPIIRESHSPTLTTSDNLDRVETEAGQVPETTKPFPAIGGPQTREPHPRQC